MRRDNQPHVNLARLSRTDSRHQSVREHAQQLRLRCHGQLARFVQEERTLMGGFEQALAGAVGPGERAALVSEQLAFQQRVGECGAVDRDQRLCGAVAAVMNGPGHEFLASPGLSGDENSNIRRRDASNLLAKLSNRSAASANLRATFQA
jgi:hypothetical protein